MFIRKLKYINCFKEENNSGVSTLLHLKRSTYIVHVELTWFHPKISV